MPVTDARVGTRVRISPESPNYPVYIHQSANNEGVIAVVRNSHSYIVVWDHGYRDYYRDYDLEEVTPQKPKPKSSGFKSFQRKINHASL